MKSESKPQPHSDLREMLQNITPLPWVLGIGQGDPERFIQGEGDNGTTLVADCFADTWEEIACPSQEEARANAQYLVHCAIILPRLLKAAEAFEEDMRAWFSHRPQTGDEENPILEDSNTWNALHDAIAEAHGGNVAARLTAEDMPTGGPITSPKDELRTYTVLLLYPDYIASNFGQETYMTSVQASDPTEAITKAQRAAFADDMEPKGHPDDFFPLMVIEGEHRDVKP